MPSQEAVRIVVQLTEESPPGPERRRALQEFARVNGWRPSENIEEYPGTSALANGHLVVEHGLANTAVISFLKSSSPFGDLGRSSKLQLLCLSYNNLVDWHFFPDREGLNWIYNRTDPPFEGRLSVHEVPDTWSAQAFDRVVGRRPNPSVRALDDALISTISDWKRKLALELPQAPRNEELSALFNAILFTRALEDYRRWQGRQPARLLLQCNVNGGGSSSCLSKRIRKALRRLGLGHFPRSVLGCAERLAPFDVLDPATVTALFADFYDNRFAPYEYDFSLMSKHALSRIYEHYVSLLREPSSPQLSLFRDIPEEVPNKALGGVYTPQYIARFFAKFLQENLTPPGFRQLRAVDPTCGSGMFLRTLLEMQCDPSQDVDLREVTNEAFRNVMGIDVDENACNATRLSLALLHLVLTGSVPRSLKVVHDEALNYFQDHPRLKGSFGAVIANPPYIKWEHMPPDLQARVRSSMGSLASGRPDACLAHLKVGLDLVAPGGFVLYVMPHSFLLANNAKPLRETIARSFWIRTLADLSEIPVFGAVGSYVVLLILQKPKTPDLDPPTATIVKCREFVGHALQDAVEGKRCETPFYHIYDVHQSAFQETEWRILPPAQLALKEKLEHLPRLDEFLSIREGFVTGADKVFIRDRTDIDEAELPIYRPYLPDRSMRRFSVPRELDRVVFYPYLGRRRVTLEEIKRSFPTTWAHLKKHAKELRSRRSVAGAPGKWWLPVRPRRPENILRPKILTPHLTVLPRFSLDSQGTILVSRSPFLFAQDRADEIARLSFFLAILNSSVIRWQLTTLAHRYSRGYLMMEKKTLAALRVPCPTGVPATTMTRLQELVEARQRDEALTSSDADLDDIVSDLYGLSQAEMAGLGLDRGS